MRDRKTPLRAFAFVTAPILSNERVLLRKIESRDLGAIVDISFYDGVAATSEEDAAAMLHKIEQDCARGESVHWGICLRGNGDDLDDVVVGTCGFYRGFPDGIGEIGYILREAYRGAGIMRSAIDLIVKFGFEQMKLSSIIALTDPDNAASIAILERSGFVAVPSSRQDSLQFARSPAQPTR